MSLPLLNLGNKMLYLSLEAGRGILCRSNPAATLLVNKHFNFCCLWAVAYTTLDTCMQFFNVIFNVLINSDRRRGMINLETRTIAWKVGPGLGLYWGPVSWMFSWDICISWSDVHLMKSYYLTLCSVFSHTVFSEWPWCILQTKFGGNICIKSRNTDIPQIIFYGSCHLRL